MNAPPTREKRPRAEAPSLRDSAGGPNTPILAHITPEQAAATARGAYVVVVHLYGDRFRRRVFLTLAAAEKCARAAEDRGHQAHTLLARIEPVAHVDGGGSR